MRYEADAFTIAGMDLCESCKAKTVIISSRVSARTKVIVDKLAEQWKVSPSEAMCKLAEAADSPEVVELVEAKTFVREAVLPKSYKFRVVSDFRALVGLEDIQLRRGQILSLDGYDFEMLKKLYARGAQLQPIG